MSESIVYGIPKACELANTCRSKIYAAIKSGDLVAKKHGRRTVILDDDLRRWIKSWPSTKKPDIESHAADANAVA
jgi:Helix-turn-helix domain